MPDESPQVLSVEEWADLSVRRDDGATLGWHQDAVVVIGHTPGMPDHTFLEIGNGFSGWGAASLPALIALANAALPEGHPQKITRADVAVLEDAFVMEGWNVDDERTAMVQVIAAKLRALLP